MGTLTEALASVRDRTSLYWAFYESEGITGSDELVEVRLNGTPATVRSLQIPEGWSVRRVKWGESVFLRRCQPLTEDAVEEMLIQMLKLAEANGMQLHSWLHGAHLD